MVRLGVSDDKIGMAQNTSGRQEEILARPFRRRSHLKLYRHRDNSRDSNSAMTEADMKGRRKNRMNLHGDKATISAGEFHDMTLPIDIF